MNLTYNKLQSVMEEQTMMKKFLFGGDKVTVDVHDICKYEKESKVIHTNKYEGVEGFDVLEGEAAVKLEVEIDGNYIDPYHEYLVIYMKSGETATFRNSFVDMFHF